MIKVSMRLFFFQIKIIRLFISIQRVFLVVKSFVTFELV